MHTLHMHHTLSCSLQYTIFFSTIVKILHSVGIVKNDLGGGKIRRAKAWHMKNGWIF